MANENFFIELAQMTPEKNAVVIMDRGYLDNMAYISQEDAEYFTKKSNINLEYVRDTRYDMVIHMVTAANGAEKYYSLENNKARTESVEMAVSLDNKIKDCWNGHSNHMLS